MFYVYLEIKKTIQNHVACKLVSYRMVKNIGLIIINRAVIFFAANAGFTEFTNLTYHHEFLRFAAKCQMSK